MDVIQFLGGIGNQMFQYAFGKTRAMETGKPVVFDLSWYSSRGALHPLYPRPFRLDKFQLTDLKEGSKKGYAVVDERRVGYNPDIFKRKGDFTFYGYWQYYTYYKAIIPALQAEFQVKPEYYTPEYLKLKERIINSNSVSMHVRRGDYQLLRKGTFKELAARYYFDAISLTQGDLFIFSDDIKWCQETFKQEYFDRQVIFVDMIDYLCFDLMRQCKQHINSNSTYSWWASVLDTNPDKKVICPLTYQGDSVENSAHLRYPKDWIIINDYTL